MKDNESTLAKITAFAISLISLAVLYKSFNVSGWETYAYLGGALLFFVITIILGTVFDIGLLVAMLSSAFITALIMVPIYSIFSLVMMITAMIVLLVIVAIKAYEEGEL